jgi:UDP-N-acetylglucosamine 4,6-dehydratase
MPEPKYQNVLITGGTGFLGRALVKHLLENTTANRICIFSRGEFAQATMRQAIADPDGRLRWFIGDVRDSARVKRAMDDIGLVIHAAALKRVEVGEYNPAEMVLTNCMGAINVIEAAHDAHVEKVLAISSDKACAPLNAYGATKLVMEKLMMAANNASGHNGPIFSCVRYGNVAGSTGSVIPVWRELLRQGLKKVPVSDPICRRFWMTVEEAVELIMWTIENMIGGELVVPLLPAYSLATLAEAMAVEVEVKGLGSGEKLDEMMVAPFESQEFRWIDPYLVRGGLAKRYPEPNIGGIRTHMLGVEELRWLLKNLPE